MWSNKRVQNSPHVKVRDIVSTEIIEPSRVNAYSFNADVEKTKLSKINVHASIMYLTYYKYRYSTSIYIYIRAIRVNAPR